MAWNGAPEAPPSVRIAALLHSFQPSERRVAEAIAADPSGVVEGTAQQLADQVGVGRASVIRTAQTLGRTWPSLPADAYSMNGFQGQRVIIIPSKQLVVVRLGFSGGPDRGIEPLVAGLIEVLDPD